ncbi:MULTISPECIES: hypothetical protein [unclassified Bradyrhizobium]|uniref:hypothetical protein n=1 Tax=unclassified Bradyrhizobium TaxID=2631580 RepID=UPI001FF7F69E|nr:MULTISPECIES: hypothetical protein [unclassified Bradyrhizobium]MCK1708099.1 hypothetical protein [Bradyrhizobium sp. 143]MCK1726783.1 hypothetical protein [Bradyrhizobium sp. 142]
MRFVRTILAFAIAVSLAMLPVGTSAAGLAMAPDDMQTGMHMSGDAAMSMDECCPHDMKGTSPPAGSHKCGMGFCCAGGTLALDDVRALDFVFLAIPASKVAIPADQVVSVRGGSPPFRPPRV